MQIHGSSDHQITDHQEIDHLSRAMMTTLVDRSMCTRMDGDDDDSYIPCTCDELDDGAEEEESAVEEEAHVPPVLPQQPIQNLKPLLITFAATSTKESRSNFPYFCCVPFRCYNVLIR